MSETEPGQIGAESVRESDEPMVTDPERAGTTEQTGGWGTGTPGSSNVAGQRDTDADEQERSKFDG